MCSRLCSESFLVLLQPAPAFGVLVPGEKLTSELLNSTN
jgi:hypothetical protein